MKTIKFSEVPNGFCPAARMEASAAGLTAEELCTSAGVDPNEVIEVVCCVSSIGTARGYVSRKLKLPRKEVGEVFQRDVIPYEYAVVPKGDTAAKAVVLLAARYGGWWLPNAAAKFSRA